LTCAVTTVSGKVLKGVGKNLITRKRLSLGIWLPTMKFDKNVFQSFEYNISKAKALSRTHGYLKDIINGEEGNVAQILQQVLDSILELSGIKPIVADVQKKMQDAMVVRMEELGQEYLEERKDQLEQYLSEEVIPSLEKILGDLNLLIERVLLEQTIVTAVSAYETFWKDLLISLIGKNRSVEEKFFEILNKEVKYESIRDYDDVHEAMGEIVATTLRRTDMSELEKVYARIFGRDLHLLSTMDSDKLRKFFEIRHIIVHNAGHIDLKFKKRVGTGQKIGDLIELNKGFVDKCIVIMERSVDDCAKRIGYSRTRPKHLRSKDK